jgi:hypothetical protein
MMIGITHPDVRRVASITRQDQRDAEDLVPQRRHRVAVGEGVAVPERPRDDRHSQERQDHVPPHEAVAEAPRDREQHEGEEEHEPHVDLAQEIRADDAVGGVQVEGGGRDRGRGQEYGEPAAVAVETPLFLLEVFLDLALLLFRERAGRILVCLRHDPGLCHRAAG